MNHSDTIAEIAAALAAFNAEVKNPPENKTAEIKGQKASYSFNFADLAGITDAVRPLLAKHGISVVQNVLVEEHRVGAVTTLLHASGEWLEFSPLWVPAGPETKDYGGATTYSRRYALMAALDLASAEDPEALHTRRAAPDSKAATAATDAQQKKIHVEAKQAGVTDAVLAEVMQKRYQVGSAKELTKTQASDLIERLIEQKKQREELAASGADPDTGEVAGGDDDYRPEDEAPGMDAEEYKASRQKPPEELPDGKLA